MSPDRWEHGSDWYYPDEWGTASYPWTALPHSLWGSARAALAGLFAYGRDHHGWRRLWVPGFFCTDALLPLQAAGAKVMRYVDVPTRPVPAWSAIPVHEGDTVLVVNYYGLRGPLHELPAGVAVIEDHTHDPFVDSHALYCLASLRKTLPVPDGAVAWSPCGQQVPEAPSVTATHSAAVFERLSGMLLKSRYLAAECVEKEQYRALLVSGEHAFSHEMMSGISTISRNLLPLFPTDRWRQRRRDNFKVLHQSLGTLAGVRVLCGETTPFACTLLFDDARQRDAARRQLIESRVYPAVLWPLSTEQASALEVDVAARVLTLHCDHRYYADDMRRIAGLVRRALA